jgi:ABC-2 type transport system permease protein
MTTDHISHPLGGATADTAGGSTAGGGAVLHDPAEAQHGQRPVRMVARLTALELRLMLREPMVLVGLLGLPVVAMVVIAGVFGNVADPDFGGVAPDDYYVASYVGVVLASLGLVTLPVHLATSRELGVIRRYRASGIGGGALVATQVALGLILGVVASALVLAIGHLAYDLQAPEDLAGVVGWFALGLVCHVALGCALGLLVPGGRAANALGNLLFLPTFLLGGGGPPRGVMNDAMRAVADVLPLSHITAGMRREWLGATDATVSLWWPIAVAGVALAVAVWVTGRRAE